MRAARQHFYQPDFTLPLDEPGASFEVDSFGGRNPVTKQAKRLRESVRPAPLETIVLFDDTYKVYQANLSDGNIGRRLNRHLREGNDPRFERGVPTNGATSATNYPKDNVKIIDGEHKTLLSLGKINEAMDDDDHTEHILAHRLELSDPNLSETRRNALLEHIADHSKKNRKRMKAVAEAKEGKFKKGLGVMSRPKPATQYDVIPQDAEVDLERKRTAGNIAMEARMARFDRATSRAYGGGRASRRGL